METVILAFFIGLLLGFLISYLKGQKLYLSYEILKEKFLLQEKIHIESNEKFELKIKEISQKIIEEKTKSFKEDSFKGLEQLLNPFRDKINDFQRKVEEIHMTDTKDRLRLHLEIEKIVMTGQKMSLETENLTRALKGDIKLQGNWGELILEKVLEASGLREGEEFTLQGKDLKLKDDEGKHQMPDVIIQLPEGKHLIIDSKVSLVSYERYINGNNEEDLGSFTRSLQEHIRGLAKKSYHQLDKLITPDYVMLFIPIEGAFTLAMQTERELFQFAWERNIVIVSPSTLLATLRTVASLWKQEKQNKNALEIARQAGALYDKFTGVAEDIEVMQAQFRKLGDTIDTFKGKMLTGKGSMASRMENLRELGARNTKTMSTISD